MFKIPFRGEIPVGWHRWQPLDTWHEIEHWVTLQWKNSKMRNVTYFLSNFAKSGPQWCMLLSNWCWASLCHSWEPLELRKKPWQVCGYRHASDSSQPTPVECAWECLFEYSVHTVRSHNLVLGWLLLIILCPLLCLQGALLGVLCLE